MAVNQLDIEVGQRINDLVESQQNISSRQFALSIGMDPSQFAKIVKGTAGISLEKLVEISSKYQVSIEWLVTGVTSEEKFQLAEGDPGYKKEPAPGAGPDLLTAVKNEIAVMRASLDKLAIAAGVHTSSNNTTDPGVKQDLSLDKKKRSLNRGENSGS